uniref:Growth-regulating factor n=1 Tax=Kalanchoe fedtschenkoi TaxID=63787 RepID=A0A7N0U1A6_KALFE
MVDSATQVSRLPDGAETGIDLGLELGLGSNFEAEMRKYKERVVVVLDDEEDDDDRRRKKRVRVPMGFTFMQRQELEQQACIFRYIEAGAQVPYPLLYPIWKSVAGSADRCRLPFIPNLFAGPVGLSWKQGRSDPEPGRCKRTDGKKWRCAKEAMPEYKYCEKHLHRGRHRSRKLVDPSSATGLPPPPPSQTKAPHFPAPERIGLSIALPSGQ